MFTIGISPLNSIPVQEMVELSQLAEGLGFSHMWLPDEKWMRSPWQNASSIARSTTKITAGISCANTMYRHPAVIADEAQTLAESAQGRAAVSICLGSSHALHLIGSKWRSPLKTLEESTFIVRSLLRGDTVNFSGDLFQLNDLALGFKAPPIPVLLAGSGPRIIQLASRVADGVILDDIPLPALEQVFEWIDKGLDESGRSRKDFFVTNLMPFGMQTDDYDGLEGAKFFSVWQVGTNHSYIQNAMQQYSTDMAIVRSHIPDQIAASKAMSNTVFKAFAIAGTPEECIMGIESYKEIGVNHIGMMMPFGVSQRKTIQEVGTHIVEKKYSI